MGRTQGAFGTWCYSVGAWAVIPLGENEAHEAGWLPGKSRTADVIDAVVVTIALRQHALILTSDTDDIKRLVLASGRQVAIVAV